MAPDLERGRAVRTNLTALQKGRTQPSKCSSQQQLLCHRHLFLLLLLVRGERHRDLFILLLLVQGLKLDELSSGQNITLRLLVAHELHRILLPDSHPDV